MKQEQHPLYEYPENEKIDYLTLIATLASADGNVSDEEISFLRQLCKNLKLSSKGVGVVLSVAEDPEEVDVEHTINRLSQTKLRFTLITDMLFLAKKDQDYRSEEKRMIQSIAKKLNIEEDQLLTLEKYVDAIIRSQEAGNRSDELKALGGEVLASLSAAGIPLVSVASVGTVSGLSAAGITSGLAALGLGFGMATGIGTVAAIGAGSYMGTRYIYKRLFGL